MRFRFIDRDYRIKPGDLSDGEYRLRRMLFFAHANSGQGCMPYGDDGELSCNSCDIDFLRDTPKQIEDRIGEKNMERLVKLQEQAAQTTEDKDNG